MPTARLALAWALALASALPTPALAQRRDTTQRPPEPPLRFAFAGPAAGGRISAVAGIPGSSETYYAGGASGGVWKTTDGGRTWAPIFDREDVQAIGALAVSSDTNTVWAGTGEAWAIRDADVVGDGVYKSTDGGRTWKRLGLEATGRIGRIVVHPTNPNTVFVCALGHAYGPQQERGVYRTTDGGATWQRVLFVDENTGCSGLALDPHDPNTLFAGTWQVVMHTWGMFGGGPGSAVWRSKDGGNTWTRLKDPGLPKSPLGKIDVAVAPADSKRVYALIQTANQGSLWRSDDGGDHWKVVSWDRTLIGRAGYYIRLAVSTKDPNEVLVTSSSLHRSTDGGQTFTEVRGGCGDCHDSWFDPTNADRYAVTGDGGLGITTNHGRTFLSVALPVAQMYHVALDERNPYWVYGNRQDDGTMRGPSDAPDMPANVPSMRRGRFGGGSTFEWQHGLGGCESGFTLPDPTDPDVVWATCYSNEVTRWDGRTRVARAVSPWMHTFDSPPDALKYRCHWTPPLAIDPFDHNTVYYGCQVIFKTSDGGQTWSVISPDLSTRDPRYIVSSGGLVADNLGQFYGEVVFAIAPSKIQKGLIWAGTNDGKVWLTRDGGAAWSDVTKNVTGLPVWGTVRRIFPSAFDAGTAYMAVDAHLMNDPKPYIFKTTDFGATWSRISDALPSGHPLSYVMAVAEDPNKRGLLFAGTGHDFFYSPDDGATWTSLREGLPAAPASWVEVAKTQHDVVVSTYGRGIYILHDIAPLEQGGGAAVVAGTKLYRPTPGLRRARSGEAMLYFSLPQAPKDSVQLQVLTADGAPVRTLKTAARAGLNRVAWDLRYEGPQQVELRTVAPDNPHIWDEPRFKGKATRPVMHWGIEQPQRQGPIVPPGTYQVRLALAPDGAQTEPLVVLKDSTITASAEDLAASTAAQLRVRAAIDSTASMANRIEVMRKQIEDLRAANPGRADVLKALDGLDTRMLAVEHRFLSRSDMQSDDKFFVEPYGLYLNLIWLSAEIGSGGGDVAGGADQRPTAASLALLSQREQELAAAAADYQTLMDRDLPAFNNRMAGKLPPIGGVVSVKVTTTSER